MGSNPNNYVWFGEEYKTDIYDLYNSKENLFYGLNLESDSECMAFKNYLGNNSSSVSCIKTKNQKDKILWRIIGVMKNVKSNSYDNNSSSRIKLIRDDSIGPYAWDSSGISTNYGHGVNEWSIADINLILNDYYYNNKANQICNVYINNVSLTCSFNKYGFPENLKKMTSPTLWYTGSNGSVLSTTNIKTAQFYKFERSNNIGKTCTSGSFCNDGSPRSVTWSGNIALMYPSDYGYATSGGNTTNRTKCLNTPLYNWKNMSECYNNNWLYKNGNIIWSITPAAFTNKARRVFEVGYFGGVDSYHAANGIMPNDAKFDGVGTWILPTLYLKPETKIIEGIGNKENPFILSLD